MNKKLLALAIGAAVAMPVSAVAAPTLYGQLNLSLENRDNGTTDVWAVESRASRIGVKGSADTSVDGLKGLYLAEYGVNADDNVGAVFTQRNIYAGLEGGFGKLLAGHIDTPLKSAQGMVDQFNDTWADMDQYIAGDLRASNVIYYSSPKLADAVTINVALIHGEGAAGPDGQPLDGIADAVSASVVYANAGLHLALALDQETPTTATGMDLDGTDGYNDLVRFVAGYSADSFEVGFLYQTGEGADTPATGAEDTSMLLSGAFKTGSWKFKAQFGQTEGEMSNDTDEVLAIGADYALGKATTVYGLVATAENDGGRDDTMFGLGLLQKF